MNLDCEETHGFRIEFLSEKNSNLEAKQSRAIISTLFGTRPDKEETKMDKHSRTEPRRHCPSADQRRHSASLHHPNKSPNHRASGLVILFLLVNLCIIFVNCEQTPKRKPSIDLKRVKQPRPIYGQAKGNVSQPNNNNDKFKINHASSTAKPSSSALDSSSRIPFSLPFSPPISSPFASSSPFSFKHTNDKNLNSPVDRKSSSRPLPKPSSLLQSAQNDCPALPANQSPSTNSTGRQAATCTCYAFDDGIYIECDHSVSIQTIRLTLSLLKGRLVKSFTIYHLNDTINNLLSDFLNQPTDAQSAAVIERFQVSYSTMRNLSEIAFRGLDASLKQLSITNGQLRSIPQNALKQLKRLETLDLDGNQIDQLDSYAFYGLPLTMLNLQSNKLHTLLEYAFGGLEHTLEELILMHNSLTSLPLIALRRLRKLKTLKLAGNIINELTDDGFTRFTALQNLDLSNNRLTSLNERSLITMPKLVSLSLASNRLSSLTSPFVYLLELETLDLSHNAIRTLNEQVFANLRNLRTLDLSSNHLHNLPTLLLHPLQNLRELYLSKNNLLRIGNQTFANNSQIQALFISHNGLSEIQLGTFSHLTTMQQLHLSFNQLRDIQGSLFKANSVLRTLALDNNLIANLQAGCFQELVELRDLRLQRNLLKRIQRGVFYSFPALQELDLEYNRIEALEPQALQSLVSLQYLNLQGNRLIEVGGDSLLSGFPSSLKHVQLNHNQILNIHNGGLKGQTQLEVIWINHNKLQKLSTGIFNDLTNCEKLYLQYNELASIEPGVFQSMSQLVYLNLEHNNLAQLSIDLFKGANQLSELHLAHNHIMDIEAFVFSSLPSLRYLSLDNNQIYVLRQNVFSRNDLKDNLPIEQLSLANVMIEELEMDTLSSLKQLRSLDLSENNLNLSNLNLTNLNSLTELNLKGNNLTVSVTELCKVKQLEQLDASNTRLSLKLLDKLLVCLTNLRRLSLNENELEKFELEKPFSNGTKEFAESIEQLYLEQNQLTAIPGASTMRRFGNLRQLSLARNSIRQIFKSELQFNRELRLLNLSSNGLSVIDALCFHNLSSLTVLDLSNNVMRSLPANVFAGLDNLEELLLNGNWFQHIPNNLFAAQLPSLRTLSFNHNPLQRVREDLSVIGGFPQLINLNLANCSLTLIASHDFFGLPLLAMLNLKNNRITKISPGSFRPLEKLVTLDLENNELEILPEERLTGLGELITLNLTGNHLLEMPAFSRDLKRLKSLDISRNRLSRVDTFGNLGGSLEHLNLNGNKITWMESSAFQNFTSLKSLDLSKNHLTHFSELIFGATEVTLERLSLSGKF